MARQPTKCAGCGEYGFSTYTHCASCRELEKLRSGKAGPPSQRYLDRVALHEAEQARIAAERERIREQRFGGQGSYERMRDGARTESERREVWLTEGFRERWLAEAQERDRQRRVSSAQTANAG